MQSDPNGPGSLDARLKPTLTLTKHKKTKSETKGLGISNTSHHGLHALTIFQHSDKSTRSSPGARSPASRSALSQSNLTPARTPSQRSLSTMHSTADSDDRDSKYEKSKRLAAAYQKASEDKKKKEKEKEKDGPTDDLTQMMSRASNYMTLAYVKIPSMVLCLSYKGQGKRNIEDVHDLVFKLPTLEYRNKTWSNLDLAMQLKKDVVRALISHAGAIVGNKFSHHKPNKQVTSKLRELANRSTFMSANSSQAAWAGGQSGTVDWTTTTSSETSSFMENSIADASGRPYSARPASSHVARSMSYSSYDDSSPDLRFSEDGARSFMTNGENGFSSAPPPSQHGNNASPKSLPGLRLSPPSATNTDDSRNRAVSITRHLTGLSDRLKQKSSTSTSSNSQSHHSLPSAPAEPSAEDVEESKRKRNLLLGPQKLLGRLRD
ncbi:hypothetical protein CKM354_000066100 [Cercospora kikuchii]|nr:uncharacterized protein CKM354_000066100 [Cercospora kikuchii]GIZ37207.1 hypothetical protein CKM354_000066100 [Cercospora kikuchii]